MAIKPISFSTDKKLDFGSGLLIIIMINKLILNLPYNIIELTKSGSIINILYIGVIDFIFLVVPMRLNDEV